MTNQCGTTGTGAHVGNRNVMPRRSFLRGAGTVLALPLLDAMFPSFARAENKEEPRRMLAICNNLGLRPELFFPEKGGRDYAPSPYLELLKEHRDDFTVINGTSHPGVIEGHSTDNCFLTAAPHPGRSGFRNTISLDQYAAERMEQKTRYRTLTLGVNVAPGNRSLSWTGSGVQIPCECNATEVYRRLFLNGTPAEIAARKRELAMGKSVLDSVKDQAADLQQKLGARDRERIGQYFDSVRQLEQRLAVAREWEDTPLPKVKEPEPVDPGDQKHYMIRVRLMYDLARLVFETDSARLVTLMLDGYATTAAMELEGTRITQGYHQLSHHSMSQQKLNQLKAIDERHMQLLNGLFTSLKASKEDGQNLLDRTMVLYGSNLGNANNHVTANMPIIFAGGGFKHGQHLLFDREHNYPLPNLFVSMLQRLGIETDEFASSTGRMSGLELK